MQFCFVKEDLAELNSENPLAIQAEYAKKIKCFFNCDIQKQIIYNAEGDEVHKEGQTLCLRTGYDKVDIALEVLEKNNVKPLEGKKEIEAIEKWYELPIIERDIFYLSGEDVVKQRFSDKLKNMLMLNEYIFLKSVKKGFSLKCNSYFLLSCNIKLECFLKKHCENMKDMLLISKYYSLKKDSLGNMEARFFIFNNKILNGSRYLYFTKHTVPKRLRYKAIEITEKIAVEKFPSNYVLDIGCFSESGKEFVDIVEINPISVSQCYVNNSIFMENADNIQALNKKYGFGNEYCYDFSINPNKYVLQRKADKNISVREDNRYELDVK